MNTYNDSLISNSRFYKWELVFWLWLAFFFNQADRQVYSVVLPQLRDDLHLTDKQLGLIASVFIWTLAVMVPFAGYAGDRFRKKWIVTGSILFWSVATLFTGFSAGFVSLMVFRSIATGGGEAFYAPAASAYIGEFHRKSRATALSIHQTSLYVGVVTSGFLSGYIADHWGWKSAFYGFGAAGILLSVILMFRLKDAPSGFGDVSDSSNRSNVTFKNALSKFFQKPTALFLTMAFAGMVFVNIGYLTWMPTFLHERFHLTLAEAGFASMFYHHLFAFIGVMLGGQLSDRWSPACPKARLGIQAVGLLLGAPFIYCMGQGNTQFYIYIALAAFGFFRGLYDSNIYASLYEVIEPKYRSSTSGIMILFAFLTGAFSPLLLGILKPNLGLSFALSSLFLFYIFASLSIVVALLFFFDRDRIEQLR